MEEKQKYRFNSQEERYKRMNRFFVVAVGLIWITFFGYMLLKALNSHISLNMFCINSAFLIASYLFNLFVYKKDKATKYLKRNVVIEMIVEYLVMAFATDATFFYYPVLLFLVILIPYYDKKNFRSTVIIFTIIHIVVSGVRLFEQPDKDVNELCEILCVLLFLYTVNSIGNITKMFSDDALGSVQEQSEKQNKIMEKIIDITKTVSEESHRSHDLIDGLVDATQSVSINMKEISDATFITAKNIEEQSEMTRNIQDAIDETNLRSKEMVDIATESNESIRKNMAAMKRLENQSARIVQTNNEVTQAMSKLKDKTKDVENIVEMILNISSQTNLLALNASIESARAGEAGRGFAVVAEQIRQLAEQTKTSTEEISKIVIELNENANRAVESIDVSVKEVSNQNEEIISAAQSFEKLNEDIERLISNIGVIDNNIESLAEDNNNIVDKINHLSEATQEITSSTERVLQMSEENLQGAESVKVSINTIDEKAEGMKEYI